MSQEACRSELLVVFLKYPEPGRVKTRLATTLGDATAAAIYRELVLGTLESVGAWLAAPPAMQTSAEPRRSVWIAFDPPEGEVALREWLDPVTREWLTPPRWLAQGSGDLGHRLQLVSQQVFEFGFSAVCVIGTDCPGLGGDTLHQAFARLRTSEGVIGPATDGGYYLIGVKKHLKELFQNIPWSTDQAFSTTLRAAERVGVSMACLSPLDDVDTEDDWRRWKLASGI
jgi:rSAM/selenodomain-associated transferase 1